MKLRLLSIILFIWVFAFVFLGNNCLNTQKLVKTYQTYRYPTILIIPGLGLHGSDYQYLINHLQEDKYTVITYAPDDVDATNYQKLILEWTKRVSKQIGDKKVIVIGHSVGGSVASYFCSIDNRCIAGINMDGSAAFINKIPVPFLYLQADTGSYCDTPCYQGRADMEKIVSESGSQFIHISGIKHYNFTDLRTQTLKDEDYLGPLDGRNIIYTDIKAFIKQSAKKYILF